MIYRAVLSAQNEFRSLPETGMGYQVIEARETHKSYSERFVVYNSELIIDDNEYFFSNKSLIKSKGFRAVLNEASAINLTNIRVLDADDIKQFKMMEAIKKSRNHRYSGGTAAIDSRKEYANGTDIFVRLSAYANDKRIDFVNKKLIDGSFTTTYDDYRICYNTNDDPIDRYALPNDEAIQYAFYIKPKSIDMLQRGIVQPAFSHDGGGIEIYFENGTSNNTYLEMRNYGQ